MPPASCIIYVSVVKVSERRWRRGTSVKVKGGAIDEKLLPTSPGGRTQKLLIKESLRTTAEWVVPHVLKKNGMSYIPSATVVSAEFTKSADDDALKWLSAYYPDVTTLCVHLKEFHQDAKSMRVLVCLTQLQGDEQRGRANGEKLLQQLTSTMPHLLPHNGPLEPAEEAGLAEELRKANTWELQYQETAAQAEALRDYGREQLAKAFETRGVKASRLSAKADRLKKWATLLGRKATKLRFEQLQTSSCGFWICSKCFPCCCCDCCLDCPCWKTDEDAEAEAEAAADQPIPPAVEAGPALGVGMEPRL